MTEKAQCSQEGSREEAGLELGVWTPIRQRGHPSGPATPRAKTLMAVGSLQPPTSPLLSPQETSISQGSFSRGALEFAEP